MAKHNEPLLLRKAVKVKVDGEERELAAGTEVSAEVAKSLGLAKGKGGVIAAPQ